MSAFPMGEVPMDSPVPENYKNNGLDHSSNNSQNCADHSSNDSHNAPDHSPKVPEPVVDIEGESKNVDNIQKFMKNVAGNDKDLADGFSDWSEQDWLELVDLFGDAEIIFT